MYLYHLISIDLQSSCSVNSTHTTKLTDINKSREDNNKLQPKLKKPRKKRTPAKVVKSATRATLAAVFAVQDTYELP